MKRHNCNVLQEQYKRSFILLF